MSAQFVIGIDLGTTNSALAYAAISAEVPQIELLAVPQLVAAGTIENRTLLPSFLYLGTEPETAAAALELPWTKKRNFAVGEMARRLSAEAPDRSIAAAKSWLCHSKVDRRAPLLPNVAAADVQQLSPVTVSQRYLEHLAAAWKQAHPDAHLADQIVVLTVPASFDAAARELTREAAIAAGLPESVVLLEEPQAAIYCWLSDRGDSWRRELRPGDSLLVCDVGGGTTDLTLVNVVDAAGELSLQRVAVGNHLLVGGDNMDLALAHYVSELFAAKGTKLDPWQSVSLWHSCRAAKEALLTENGPKQHTISVLGRGSKLIAKTVSVEVDRDTVQNLLLSGFFPDCQLADKPQRRRASGFQELGLNYEQDPAITRHLAEFLCTQGASQGEPARPSRVLFNGGVFKADRLREQLLTVLGSWANAAAAPQPLVAAPDLDHAVARGAAFYAWTKHRGGVRIRGGAPRSYYVGIETSGLAIPGAPRPLRALCVVPQGMEEGTEIEVPDSECGLVVGAPVVFRFFSSGVRKQDVAGTSLMRWSEDELQETDSLEQELPSLPDSDESYLPVKLQARLTELGMLELWSVGTSTPGKWKFEFSVRDQDV